MGAARPGVGVDATSLQIPGVLDDLYAAKAAPYTMGPSFKHGQATLRVWAPTARSGAVRVFADSDPATAFTTQPMTLDPASGIWSHEVSSSLYGQYYLYEAQVYVRSSNRVETNVVTDPYSVSLAKNSTRSQIVSLEDSQLQPRGWNKLNKPYLAAPEEHCAVRIARARFQRHRRTVPTELRGTYAAFTQKRSNGMKHLAMLGLAASSVAVPAFDFASTNEDKSTWVAPSFDTLASLPPDSSEQQSLVAATSDRDGFNWGYDPCTTTCPKQLRHGCRRFRPRSRIPRDGGSLNKWTACRHGCGLQPHHRVEPESSSILDRLVPGYHRLNGDGVVLGELLRRRPPSTR